MNRVDPNIKINEQYGLNTRATSGRPTRRNIERKPVNLGPALAIDPSAGVVSEAKQLMDFHRGEAEAKINAAVAKGTPMRDAVRMARSSLLAAQRAKSQWLTEIGAGTQFAEAS